MKLNHKHSFHLVDPSIWPFFLSFAVFLLSLSFVDIAFCDVHKDLHTAKTLSQKEQLWWAALSRAWGEAAAPFLKAHPEIRAYVDVANGNTDFRPVFVQVSQLQFWVYESVISPDVTYTVSGWAEEFCARINAIRVDFVEAPGLSSEELAIRKKAYKLAILFCKECIKIMHPKFYYTILRHINVTNDDIMYAV